MLRTKPGFYPLVQLKSSSYQHSDRTIGRVKIPVFQVAKWLEAGSYDTVVAGASASAPASEFGPAGDEDEPRPIARGRQTIASGRPEIAPPPIDSYDGPDSDIPF